MKFKISIMVPILILLINFNIFLNPEQEFITNEIRGSSSSNLNNTSTTSALCVHTGGIAGVTYLAVVNHSIPVKGALISGFLIVHCGNQTQIPIVKQTTTANGDVVLKSDYCPNCVAGTYSINIIYNNKNYSTTFTTSSKPLHNIVNQVTMIYFLER